LDAKKKNLILYNFYCNYHQIHSKFAQLKITLEGLPTKESRAFSFNTSNKNSGEQKFIKYEFIIS